MKDRFNPFANPFKDMDQERLRTQLEEAGPADPDTRSQREKVLPRVVNYMKRTLPSSDQPAAQEAFRQRKAARRA